MMNNRKGIAMLIVIALIMMLLILGAAALMLSSGHFGTSYHQVKRARAYYAAEAAMQHALWACRTNNLPAGRSLATGPWPIIIPFTGGTINEIPASNISITVEDENTGSETPVGVHPIKITVDY